MSDESSSTTLSSSKDIQISLDNIDLENATLSSLFDVAWKSQRDLQKDSADESSVEYQTKRKKIIEILQKCELMLDELHLFSDNESLDEVSTSELRYFLNYALIGWLNSKANSTKPEVRLVDLAQAKEYFVKYLALTRNYELHSYNVEKFVKTNETTAQTMHLNAQAAFDENLIAQAYDRNEKIRRYKEQKELDVQLSSIFTAMGTTHLDEEQRRKGFKMFLKYWINKSVDDLKLVTDEINILKSMERGRSEDGSAHIPNATSSGAMASASAGVKKPFIITRDQIQAQVFGAGYPSLPVYSIGQFYDQLADKGMMPKGDEQHKGPVQIGGGVTETQKQQEKAEKDALEDKDDEEELRKQREWDEFKDDNKRGSGNRYNRS